ncbi:hypothetical protein HGRIS_003470 [Hohenbuehelia grisea]|uniref:Uncharacterized protein n=1 Tax=Hohenbuehelia grisea TaxID=104357 RepID=A0ABR3JGL3_9AGAR
MPLPFLIFNWWHRDPKGPTLPKPGPRGKRTPNELPWGYIYNDFFFINRFPQIAFVCIWTRSQIQEFGENYYNQEHEYEPEPSVCDPWPLLLSLEGLEFEQHFLDGVEFQSIAKDIRGKVKAVRMNSEAGVEYGVFELDIGPAGVFISEKRRKVPFPYVDLTSKGQDIGTSSRPMEADGEIEETPVQDSDVAGLVLSLEAISSQEESTSEVSESAPQVAKIAGPSDKDDLVVSEGLDDCETRKSEESVSTDVEQTRFDSKKSSASPHGLDNWDAPCHFPKILANHTYEINELSKLPPFGHSYDEKYRLQEFLGEHFPDILVVNDPQSLTESRRPMGGYNRKAVETTPRRYKRVWPVSPSDPDLPSSKPKVACLNLASPPLLGVGSHSVAYRGALRLPAPLLGETPDGTVSVAVKLAINADGARDMLRNEAKTYDSFPQHMMEEWLGMNLVLPIKSPQPIGAVAPKFFGYYVPEEATEARCKRDADARRDRKLQGDGDSDSNYWPLPGRYRDDGPSEEVLSPVLLLEDCGVPVRFSDISERHREQCLSMLYRFHIEGYTHGSFYARNFLVQPGPLNFPHEERSLENPSFRLIDYGRADSLPLYIERHKSSPEGKAELMEAEEEYVDKKLAFSWKNKTYIEARDAMVEMGMDPSLC